jgi:hypothetical protein
MLRGGDGKVWLLENGKKRWVESKRSTNAPVRGVQSVLT